MLARCIGARGALGALSARVAARTLASSAEPASVLGALRRNAEELPYNTVVKAPHWDFSLTNEELLDVTVDYAAGLTSQGVGKGDSVVVWSDHDLYTMVMTLACAQVGATLHFVSPLEKETLERSKAKVLLFDPLHGKDDRYALLMELIPELDEATVNDAFLLKSARFRNLTTVLHTADNSYQYAPGIPGFFTMRENTADKHRLSPLWERLAGDADTPMFFPPGADTPVTQGEALARSRELAQSMDLSRGDTVLQAGLGGYGTLDGVATNLLPASSAVALALPEMRRLRFGVAQALDILAMDRVPAAILPDADAVAKIQEFQRGEGKAYERAVKRGMHVGNTHKTLPVLRTGLIMRGSEPVQLGNATLRPAA